MSSQPTRAAADGRAYLDLQRLARQTGRSTQELLHLYALQGFLARPRWATWRRKQQLPGTVPNEFSEVLATVIAFADPVLTRGAAGATWHPTDRTWRN